jgi:hypothetical protein
MLIIRDRTLQIGLGLLLTLMTCIVTAETVTSCDSAEVVCASISIKPEPSDPQNKWLLQITGSLNGMGAFPVHAYGLYQDATWFLNEDHRVVLEDGIQISQDGFAFGSSFAQEFVIDAVAGSTSFMFFFGSRSFSHDSTDQVVEIILEPVANDLTVSLDIKPATCPNKVNMDSQGVLPVAIAGANDFDVYSIDTDSLKLAGVAPLRIGYDDVTAPFEFLADELTALDCSSDGADGTVDLVLKFSTPQLLEAIETSYDTELVTGEEVLLELTGQLIGEDAVTLVGEDYIKVIRNNSGKAKSAKTQPSGKSGKGE